MNIYEFTQAQVILFGLIMMRMLAFVTSSAFFGAPNISAQVKILFSLTFTSIMFPLVSIQSVDYLLVSNELIHLTLREIVIGLMLGFLTRMFFFTVSMVGEFTSISMGLNSAQLFNPMMGSMGGAMEQFYSIIGILIFLGIDGHHIFLAAIAQSYQMVPVAMMSLNLKPFAEMAIFGQELLILSVKLCAPIVVAMLLSNIAMGILGRAVPQINVMVTSQPVNMMIGLAVLIVCLPLFYMQMNGLMDITATKLFLLMKAL